MTWEIKREWLEAVEGKLLFYPAAGSDTTPFVEIFAPRIRRFVFNDLFYSSQTDLQNAVPDSFSLISKQIPDPIARDAKLVLPTFNATPGRKLDPTVLIESFAVGQDVIAVERRRGFGQYALNELADRSIGVFVHRMDSPGEGGSNMCFLGNVPKTHEPLSNLWEKLASRLADQAVIVTDGSLTSFNFLKRIKEARDVHEAISQAKDKSHRGFDWQYIGNMTDRGTSIIWGLTRRE